MSIVMSKIAKLINEKVMKYGIMGSEPVNVTLTVTEEEKQEFHELKLSSNYSYEIEGNELFVTYIEDVESPLINNLEIIRKEFKEMWRDIIEEDKQILSNSTETFNGRIKLPEYVDDRKWNTFKEVIEGWDICFDDYCSQNNFFQSLSDEEQDEILSNGHGFSEELYDCLK